MLDLFRGQGGLCCWGRVMEVMAAPGGPFLWSLVSLDEYGKQPMVPCELFLLMFLDAHLLDLKLAGTQVDFFFLRCKMKEKNKIPAKVLRAALEIQFLGSMMFHFSNC